MDIKSFVSNLEAIKKASYDILLRPTNFRASVQSGEVSGQVTLIENQVTGKFSQPNEWSHFQIANKLQIPQKYYDRMVTEAPDLWRDSVNCWLKDEEHRTYLLRHVDLGAKPYPILRAFLSDRYRIIDHLDILFNAMDALKDIDGVRIEKHTLTDRYMYISFVHEGMIVNMGTADKPDIYKAGLIGANSETGGGAMYWKPRIFRQVCSNGMVVDMGLEQVHLGRKITEEFLFSDETKRMENNLIFAKVKDIIRGVFSMEKFTHLVTMLKEAREHKIEEPSVCIEQLVKTENFTDRQKNSLLDKFTEGGNNKLSLVNAVTYLAHSEEDPDKKVDLEILGGRLLACV